MRKLITGLLLFFYLASYSQSAYDYTRLQREDFSRGLVAVKMDSSNVALSWRYLDSDPDSICFDVFRNGKKINDNPLKESTFFIDRFDGLSAAVYEVAPSTNLKRGSYTLPSDAPVGYIEIPLDVPSSQVNELGEEYSYNANDATVGDIDGDGIYEIFLKWEPSNAKDNSQDGLTGTTLIDCYKIDGSRLWRIDLGKNIRSGAHYTNMMVYDFDNDGCAELVMRTADGTRDGKGRILGDKRADFRTLKGRIFSGKDYLTVFDGKTGKALTSVEYIPQRGDPAGWGDNYANRSERFLAAIAYLDGIHPSVVMCRGYYTRTVLAAFNWNGKELKNLWIFDSDIPGNETYSGQGNHNLRIADIDEDGCDEIIYGQMAVDNDGKGLYSTGLGHGDAIHLISDVDDSKYYVWCCHENKKDGTTLREASTGKIILQYPSNEDIGRCMAADIDPNNEGVELWSPNTDGIRAFDGSMVTPLIDKKGKKLKLPANFSIWWTGDLLQEILNGTTISKFDSKNKKIKKVQTFEDCTWINGSKRNPCLQGDIIGDWREEVIFRTKDNSALRIYVSTFPTEYKFHTFLQEPIYRVSIANENVGYNQPAEPGFYFGPNLRGHKFRGNFVK